MNSNTKYWSEPLHPSIIDRSTIVKDHNVYTHLGCVLLRCGLGAYIMKSHFNGNLRLRNTLIILCTLIVIIFLTKHIVNSTQGIVLWKSYLRTVVAYSIAAICIATDRNEQAGLLIISEALMGLQSRHMAFVASYLADINTKKVIS